MPQMHTQDDYSESGSRKMGGGGSRLKRAVFGGFGASILQYRWEAARKTARTASAAYQSKTKHLHRCPCDLCWGGRCVCDCLCNCNDCRSVHSNETRQRRVIENRERHRVRYMREHRCPCDTCLSSEDSDTDSDSDTDLEEDLGKTIHFIAGNCRNPTKDGRPCIVSCSSLERKRLFQTVFHTLQSCRGFAGDTCSSSEDLEKEEDLLAIVDDELALAVDDVTKLEESRGFTKHLRALAIDDVTKLEEFRGPAKLREEREAEEKKPDDDAANIPGGGGERGWKPGFLGFGEKLKDDNGSGGEKPKDDNDSGEKPSVDGTSEMKKTERERRRVKHLYRCYHCSGETDDDQ